MPPSFCRVASTGKHRSTCGGSPWIGCTSSGSPSTRPVKGPRPGGGYGGPHDLYIPGLNPGGGTNDPPTGPCGGAPYRGTPPRCGCCPPSPTNMSIACLTPARNICNCSGL